MTKPIKIGVRPQQVVGFRKTPNLARNRLCSMHCYANSAILIWINPGCNRGGAMAARFRSSCLQIKQHPAASVLIVILAVVIILAIFGGYEFNWDWTGFNRPSKTL